MELIVVAVIIGILSTVSIGYLMSAKERVANREAVDMIKSIHVAEKAYFLDHGSYYFSNDMSALNANLKLSLPTDANRNWNYVVKDPSVVKNCARAQRSTDGRYWSLDLTLSVGSEPNKSDCMSHDWP